MLLLENLLLILTYVFYVCTLNKYIVFRSFHDKDKPCVSNLKPACDISWLVLSLSLSLSHCRGTCLTVLSFLLHIGTLPFFFLLMKSEGLTVLKRPKRSTWLTFCAIHFLTLSQMSFILTSRNPSFLEQKYNSVCVCVIFDLW